MEFGNDVPNLRDGVQKVLENPTNYKITKTDPRNFPFMDIEVDLCPSCMAQFREWVVSEPDSNRSGFCES